MEENYLNKIFSWVGEARFDDILIPGYIDRDGTYPEFRPWEDILLLSSPYGMLRLDAIFSNSQLKLQKVDSIIPPNIFLEEDIELVVESRGNQFFFDSQSSYRCTGVRYVMDEESSAKDAIIKCVEFEFETRNYIFIDPEWHFGMLLSRAGGYEQWLSFYHYDDRRELEEKYWAPVKEYDPSSGKQTKPPDSKRKIDP